MHGLWIGTLLAATLGFAPLPAPKEPATDSPALQPFEGLGKVKKVSKDHKEAEVRIGRETFTLTGINAKNFVVHEAVPLSKVENGAKITVLARQQAPTGMQGVGIGPQLTSVSAIVIGDFKPPKLTEELELARLEWVSGNLEVTEKGFKVDSVDLQTGKTRVCARTRPGKPEDLKKNLIVKVKGKCEKLTKERLKERTPIQLEVEAIVALAKRVPAKDYQLILGTANK